MWTRRKYNPRPPLLNSLITSVDGRTSYHDSWEEQVFAEDSAGLLGGCIWPPRSYSCNFCRREFRSAQALGGHMNVHRRDRARLKQSSSPTDEGSEQYPDQVSSLEYYSPNPNPNSGIIGSSIPSVSEHPLASSPYSSSIIKEQRSESLILTPRSFANQIPVRLPKPLELRLELGNWKLREVGGKAKRDLDDDDDDMMWSTKRRRTDDLQFNVRSEVLKLNPIPVEELDLELRLGN